MTFPKVNTRPHESASCSCGPCSAWDLALHGALCMCPRCQPQSYVHTASGEGLDNLAKHVFGVPPRADGETDASLRESCLASLTRLADGSFMLAARIPSIEVHVTFTRDPASNR